MTPKRFVLWLALAVGCLAGAPSASADTASTRALVDTLTRAVVEILADQNLPAEEKRRRIEGLVYIDVDFDTVARLVLARQWSRFTPEQREEFVREFKKHLSLTYRRAVESYKDERITIASDRAESNGDWTVKTKIVRGGGNDIAMDYRLRKTDAGWRIIDVIVEQVSLIANYRSQMQEILSTAAPDQIIQQLREKNARGEPLKAPGT